MVNLRSKIWRYRLKLGGDYLKYKSDLNEYQYIERESLETKRSNKLENIVRHSYEKCEHYRRVIDEDILKSDGILFQDKLTSLPLLDKEILRSRSELLRSQDLNQRNWQYNTSGGSTGEPVQFIQDDTYKEWALAVKRLFNEWTGYRPGQPRIKLWGSERDLLVGNETLKTKVRRWVRNEHPLNAFQMGEADMRRFVDRINDVQPVQILAYVESAYELAQFIEREGLDVYSPQAVMTSAGTLHDHMRKTIRRVFRAPVFNRYGSREVGDIACECEAHEGLHVSAPTHYVEILRPDGTPTAPGEVGEIVVTLLTNYAMPLIRYRIGDMGAWAESSCSCGRSWPLLAEVTGRVSDTFVTDDGKRIHGEFFTHLFYGEEWVQKFQVVQESVRQITIAVVPSDPGSDPEQRYRNEMDAIREDIHSVMGQTCNVTFDFREEIPPTDSGKYRYTISRVDRERAETRR